MNCSSSSASDSVKALTAALLAVYTDSRGSGASVTLDVTLMITPALRCLNWGSTACVSAIVPSVLVSNTARAVLIAVPSSAPSTPMPALLTSTSTGPASCMTRAMLAASVTSSASTRS
ncbi:hypothetical protein D3C72_1380540 [compost metagenome]